VPGRLPLVAFALFAPFAFFAPFAPPGQPASQDSHGPMAGCGTILRPPTFDSRLPTPVPRPDVAWGEARPLSTSSELVEVDGETGDHQDDGIGSASYGLIDAPENIAVVPPQ
jgi:hypothetical protein